MARCRKTASSAVPMAPDTRWITFSALVAPGVWSRESPANAAAMQGMSVLPMPRPTTSRVAARSQ